MPDHASHRTARVSPTCVGVVVTLAAALTGCGTEGPLLSRVDAAHGGADGSTAPVGKALRPGMTLQYQITGTLDTSADADAFVTDLFDTTDAQVAELHSAGRVVMAYVSVGTLESFRDDAAQFPRATIGMPLDAYPDESWLDTRDAEVRALMKARFVRAERKGFDGLYASGLGAYQANSGFSLTREDELDYARFLSSTAHAQGSSIGLSGDFELSGDLVGEFDWVLAIGCVEQGFCDELAPFRASGLAVVDLEADATDHTAVCRQAAAAGIPVVFKRPRFDAFRASCP